MPLLLLTTPTMLIYNTDTGEVFYLKSQKLWYAASVAEKYKQTLKALFDKENAAEIEIDDLLMETGLTLCPWEKALALFEHLTRELVASVKKEQKYELRHTRLLSLMHEKLDNQQTIRQEMLSKFNVLLNEKKKEIAQLRQHPNQSFRAYCREEDETETSVTHTPRTSNNNVGGLSRPKPKPRPRPDVLKRKKTPTKETFADFIQREAAESAHAQDSKLPATPTPKDSSSRRPKQSVMLFNPSSSDSDDSDSDRTTDS